MGKKFAVIGVAGYVASKHLKAIYDNGSEVIACHDLSDSVGYLDQYSYNIPFYKDYGDFEKVLKEADYLSVCTPNHLHREHIELGLTNGLDVICEKPVVTHSNHINSILEFQELTGHKCWVILQSRYNKGLMKLKSQIDNGLRIENAKVTYITPRGDWYRNSWKSIGAKSGGLIFNIGIHLIDILQWMFGQANNITIIEESSDKICGTFIMENNTNVKWILSIEKADEPTEPIRTLIADGKVINLSEKFTNLHSEAYNKILSGQGIGIDEAAKSVDIATRTRSLALNKSIYGA